MTAISALLVRDMRLAVRVGGGALMGVLFFLIVVTLVPFAVGPDLVQLRRIGPAVLWLGALLASLLTLDRLLARLRDNKGELLMVLDRPEIPLHTNGSENDVRCQVTKRKISGGTRSDTGRDCRDAFLALNKTCAKLGIAFWDYLGSRLAVPSQSEVPYLPAIVRHRCASG